MDAVWSRTTKRADDGGVSVGGADLRVLAGEFGTPLYVIDEEDMRGRALAFRDAFSAAFAPYGATVDVYYASKASLSSRVSSWMCDDGLSIDVASGGELELALRGGMPAARIGLHGNNKSDAELRRALDVGVGRIVVDSFTEIEVLDAIATELGVVAPVMVRVTTGVHAGGHEFIATSHEDQKFGLVAGNGRRVRGAHRVPRRSGPQAARDSHAHRQPNPFSRRLPRVRRADARIACRLCRGGGCRARQRWTLVAGTRSPTPTPSPNSRRERLLRAIAAAVASGIDAVGGTWPRLSIEPGRAIAGPAGLTLYRVGVVKHVQLEDGGRRQYVAVDGGMSDNMRTITYGAEYTAAIVSRESDAVAELSRVVGKHCESGDIVVRDVDLPGDIARGDLLAVPATGAYGRVMASNYNSVLRPAVVSVRDGEATVHIRRDTLEDLLDWDVPPPRASR